MNKKKSRPNTQSEVAPSNVPNAPVGSTLGFSDLGLSETMLAALDAACYEYPTPVQEGLIPIALEDKDVIGQARTGTGKTASFAIPILEKLGTGRTKQTQSLILVPTRELAVQVRDEVSKLAHGRKLHCVATYGGQPIRGQIEKLRRGAEIVVGTPGRVLDHMSRKTLDLSQLRFVVLDEADRMLDIGFRPDIEKILRRCPDDRQTMLLSATVPHAIQRLCQRYMRNPVTLDFSSKEIAVETIDQFYFTVDPRRKFDLLLKLLRREQPQQAIVFCRTRRGTDKVYQRLSKISKGIGGIHGDMPQRSRDRVMRRFRDRQDRILVATDVVGRGIDVTTISHIINYDIPTFCDDYVHRVGRTGRMGREGVAFTFVTPEEGGELTKIEMRIDRLLKRDEIEGFEMLPKPIGEATDGESTESTAASKADDELPKRPVPELGKGRSRKRYRRGL